MSICGIHSEVRPQKRHYAYKLDWDIFEMHYKTAFYRHKH